MFTISVITVVLNDAANLEKTIRSVVSQRDFFSSIEYIVVDGRSTDGTLDVIARYREHINIFISEPDQGLYDAMNKGLELATGNGVLFLNAGDLLIGNVFGGVNSAPLFFPVRYIDILGRERALKVRSEKLGIPNCHQGILFERSLVRYDLQYRISSDYDYFLRHGYTSNIPVHEVGGHITFAAGLSSQRFEQRDREIFWIRRKNYGVAVAVLWEWKHFLKRIARRLLRAVGRI